MKNPVQSPGLTVIPETEPSRKDRSTREAVQGFTGIIGAVGDIDSPDLGVDQPLKHWAATGYWPFLSDKMSQEDSGPSHKRSRTPSYSQGARDGDLPRAYSPAFETILANNGVFMDELKGRSRVCERSKDLCAALRQKPHPGPEYTAFPLSEFLSVWQHAQNRNEGRVYRDLTPVLVPSPALLSISGIQGLEMIAEEISVEWSKCKTLGGPKPKPDFALGISPTAFDDEEIAKLQNYASYDRPTRFTDNLYFPFLLCEVKCGLEGINRADRQNMHSASMAVRAIVELFESLGREEARKLDGETLVFSISHDNERSKVYGHLPITMGGKTTFYRYPVASYVLNFDEILGWKPTRDLIMEIYYTIYPAHLRRIRDALAEMDDPRKHSMRSGMSVEEDESLEVDNSAQSSQETVAFRKPDVPASKKHKGQVSDQLKLLQQQLDEQRKHNQEQMAEQRKQSQEQVEFLKQQLKQSQEQMETQRKQSQEQIRILNQLLKRSPGELDSA